MTIRTLSLAGVLGLASLSQAAFIRTVNSGSFDLVAMSGTDADYAFLFSVSSQIGGLGFTGGTGKAHQTFLPGPDHFEGVFVLEGASPLDTMSVEFNGFLFGPSSHSSFAGSATIVGTTGAYAGLIGDGDTSGSFFFDAPTSGFWDGVIQLDVIPAPGSAALIAAAGVFGLRRRR